MASSAPAICMARAAAPMRSTACSSRPAGASFTVDGRAPLKLSVFSGSPPMLVPSPMRACAASTRATAEPPASRRASTARCLASLAKGIERSAPLKVPLPASVSRSPSRAGPQVMAPLGEAMPARASSQPASSVSASGRATAKRPASRSTAKPSARSAPAPPCASGTQASVRPASSSAAHAGAFQASSAARLTVCGSQKSRKIRVAVSTIRDSLPMTRDHPPAESAPRLRPPVHLI